MLDLSPRDGQGSSGPGGHTFLVPVFAIGITLELNQAKIVWALLIAVLPPGYVVEFYLPASLMTP